MRRKGLKNKNSALLWSKFPRFRFLATPEVSAADLSAEVASFAEVATKAELTKAEPFNKTGPSACGGDFFQIHLAGSLPKMGNCGKDKESYKCYNGNIKKLLINQIKYYV